MKREGRQHGLFRTYRILPDPLNPRPESRFVYKLDSPPTAGFSSKVPTKFTGKCHCIGCPASKARGTQKLRPCDILFNHRLVTWRVMDSRPGLNLSGFSASKAEDHPVSSNDDPVDGSMELFSESRGDEDHNCEISCIEASDDEEKLSEFGDESSYCNVGFVLNQVEEGDTEHDDEGWCFVAELE